MRRRRSIRRELDLVWWLAGWLCRSSMGALISYPNIRRGRPSSFHSSLSPSRVQLRRRNTDPPKTWISKSNRGCQQKESIHSTTQTVESSPSFPWAANSPRSLKSCHRSLSTNWSSITIFNINRHWCGRIKESWLLMMRNFVLLLCKPCWVFWGSRCSTMSTFA